MHRFVLSLLLLLSTAASAAAQRPDSAPAGPLTLPQAIERGKRQGVNAAVVRLHLRAADARTTADRDQAR